MLYNVFIFLNDRDIKSNSELKITWDKNSPNFIKHNSLFKFDSVILLIDNKHYLSTMTTILSMENKSEIFIDGEFIELEPGKDPRIKKMYRQIKRLYSTYDQRFKVKASHEELRLLMDSKIELAKYKLLSKHKFIIPEEVSND